MHSLVQGTKMLPCLLYHKQLKKKKKLTVLDIFLPDTLLGLGI